MASSTNTNITVEGGWFEGNKAGEVGGECEDSVRVTALRPETANASTLELHDASPETTPFFLVAVRIDEGYRALPVLALLNQLERSRAVTCDSKCWTLTSISWRGLRFVLRVVPLSFHL